MKVPSWEAMQESMTICKMYILNFNRDLNF